MEKIDQINGDLKKMMAQMLDYRLERILEVRKILTPEQFKKFTSQVESRGGAIGKDEQMPLVGVKGSPHCADAT